MRYLLCFSIAAALVFGSATGARADFMDWSYHWSIMPGQVLASGTGSVALALAQDGSGASTIPAVTVTTTSAATDAAPDKYHVGYNLTLHLTDNPSSQSGSLTFHGTVAGTVSATSAHLSNTFSDPTTEKVRVGGHLYAVTVNPTLLTLAAPGSATPPQINALVSVTKATNTPPSPPQPLSPQAQSPPSGGGPVGPPVHSSPEPSSLALGILASGWLGLAVLRRRFGAVTLAASPA
jgi:hypothetical protein